MRVLKSVLELAGDQAVLMAQSESPWHTTMFSGTRHTVTLRFDGDAVAIGEAFIAELPNFPDPPGHKVVEARTLWVNRTARPAEIVFQVELLLLDDERAAA
jgi:hypothetical protein